MNLIQRHIFLSVLGTSLGAIFLLTVVLLTGNALQELLGVMAGGEAPLSVILRLIGLLVPYVITYALPLGVLAGVLVCLGRMSAEREIVAMRSAGMSIWTIALPILVLAMLAAFVGSQVNNRVAPQARVEYRQILSELFRENPVTFIVPRQFIHDFPGYVLFVGDRMGPELRDFWIWELDKEQRPIRLLRAERGTFTFDEAGGALVLTLSNAVAELRSDDKPDNLREIAPIVRVGDTRIRLSIANLFGKGVNLNKPAYLTADQLIDRMTDLNAELATHGDELTEKERKRMEQSLTDARFQLSTNYALALATFSMVLVGIPLGVRVGRKETSANVALAFGMGLLYFLLVTVAEMVKGTEGIDAAIIVWIPNVLLQGTGIALLLRANAVGR